MSTTNNNAERPQWVYFDAIRAVHQTVDPEVKRLAQQHLVFKDATGGELLEMRAQLNPGPLRILDSGTAVGEWLRDLATTFPPDSGNTYIGTDLDIERLPIPPSPNITYIPQNINEPWPADWKGSFDLVHQRLVLGPGATAGDKAKLAVAELVNLLKPGGWIQLVEGEYPIHDTDGEAVRRMKQVFHTFLTINMGEEGRKISGSLKGWLEDAGCVDVQERSVDVKRGVNSNPDIAEMGRATMVSIAKGTAAFAKGLDQEALQRTLPFPKEEMPLLGEQLDAEMKVSGANFPLRVAWGRKPSSA